MLWIVILIFIIKYNYAKKCSAKLKKLENFCNTIEILVYKQIETQKYRKADKIWEN